MSLVDVAAVGVHLLFAAVWVGSIVFFTVVVLPLARSGGINATPAGRILDRTTLLSRISAAVLFLSGGHMAGTNYTAESLTGSPAGHLVLTMIGLWLALMALVEVGSSKLGAELDRKKVRAPARQYRGYFAAGSVVGVLLFLVAAALSTGTFAVAA